MLFEPADIDDLCTFLHDLDPATPVWALGLGSNLIVRDGGVPGVAVRLGKAFARVSTSGTRITAGGGAPGIAVASAARDASLSGIEFLRGIPGTAGGAVRMNAGAYGRDVADCLIEATIVRRSGVVETLSAGEFGFSYRHSALPAGDIVVGAVFQGRPGDRATIAAEMDRIAAEREASQPLRSRTGGSTFKNPAGHKAWQLVDAAGCRGLRLGGAQVSEKHTNFLINTGDATSADIEALGDDVRARVLAHSGVALEWEIERAGVPLPLRERDSSPLGEQGEGRGERAAASPHPAAQERSGPSPSRGEGTVKVAVLMGGWSAEREVSLISGAGIVAALERLGHEVTAIDMGRDVAARLGDAAPNIVFNALHGTPGEDGSVQGMLDLMGLKYTHSGARTSTIAIDKVLTKAVLVPLGIRMPGGHIVETASLYAGDPLPRPYVLKPVNEGSSVGVAIVTDASNYGHPIAAQATGPWQRFEHLLAEPFIAGRELTVAVLDGEPLAVTELRTAQGFYDYEAKYTDGLTEHICPAELPAEVEASALDMAARAHAALGCRGASRSDFRWDPAQGEAGLYLLEVNTQPGMTALSLVPEQARYRGISYDELVARILASACPTPGPPSASLVPPLKGRG